AECKEVPKADYGNNSKMLNFCQSCHSGSLQDFHNACLDCHRTPGGSHYGWTNNAPTQDDFGMACIDCHSHGKSIPPHGECHCSLDNAVKAF
ncbi:MAG TPA: hypothetical protein VHS59_04225, partial [Bacillota bacterium]|nr:hypothetical protein [Bacillota bacterium]